MRGSLFGALLIVSLSVAPQTFSPDPEGFLRNWLVLAPIAMEGESGATEIDKDFIKGEATSADGEVLRLSVSLESLDLSSSSMRVTT